MIFLTSTTPAAATASAFPSSAEEGSCDSIGLAVKEIRYSLRKSRPRTLSLMRTLMALLLISLFLSASRGFGQTPPELNSKALTILQQNCGNLGCHGGPDPYSFDVRDPASLLAAKVIQAGNAS